MREDIMNLADLIENIVLGVLSGIAASIGFWYWTARLKHPSIKICPALSYYKQEGKYRSTVALINQGKRPAADISILAELSLVGISRRTGGELKISLRVREERLPYLTFAKEEQYFLRPSDIAWHYRDNFREDLPSKLKALLFDKDAPEISLRELLDDAESEGIDACVQVFVVANDAVYGARSYPIREFRSRDFMVGDFEPGKRCTLVDGSETNPNCCQFASSPWDFMRRYSYYREIRLGCPRRGKALQGGNYEPGP
jgi:hypothetical protein